MKNIEVACYHWSNWHPTEENDIKRGKGWTEWEYLKQAVPRFEGHQQPKKPIWGYLDDSQMDTVENQINTAADYGIDAFIFDWKYQGNNTVIEQFIKAPSGNRLQFGLMVCGKVTDWDESIDLFNYCIEHYFTMPNYWKVNGACYFSIYEIGKFIHKWGGIERAKEMISIFRRMAAQKGFKVRLVAVEWGLQEFCCQGLDPDEIISELGFDAITSYVWAHNTVPEWPCGEYCDWAENAYDKMLEIEKKYQIPYDIHVSMGWDPSPRCPLTMKYYEGGPLMYHMLSGETEIIHKPYFTSLVKNNTPKEFRRALLAAKRHIQDTQPKNPIVTLYAWNEWTEGGYLEPDSVNGYGYLEAIKAIFG